MIATELRSALLILGSLSLGGCLLLGTDAPCPAGQTCTSETPEGLFFGGTGLSDPTSSVDPILPVAVGGIETISALAGTNSASPAFTGSFTAASADPSRFSVGAVTPPSVVVHGRAAGDSALQLFEPGTTTLLGQVTVPVAALSTATLFPSELTFVEVSTPPTPWALLAGSAAVPLIVKLADASGRRLVDEATTLTATSGALTRQAWDLFAVTAAPAPGAMSFAIQAGGASFAATAPVVAAVDAITLSEISLFETPPPVPVVGTDPLFFCLAAHSGGSLVAGATWALVPSANLVVTTDVLPGSPSCVTVEGNGDGAGTLEVTAGGFTQSFPFTIDPSTTRRPGHPPIDR